MHLNAMDVHARDEARILEFHINMLTPSALAQIKFINLLETRYQGEQGDIGRFWRAPGKPFGEIPIRFPSAEAYEHAKSFCAEMLTRSGMMIPAERAALDETDDAAGKADLLFRKLQARPILEMASAAPAVAA